MIKIDWNPTDTNGHFDASLHLQDIFPQHKVVEGNIWPMYSYSRPAWMIWNAIGQVMVSKGYSDEDIKKYLQSKDTRYALDGSLGDALTDAATKWTESNFLPRLVNVLKGE